MSRLPLILFWFAGFVTLAASIEYQLFVNHLVSSQPAQYATSGPRKESSTQNQIVNKPSATDKAKSDSESTSGQRNASKDFDQRTTEAEESMALATWVGSIATVLAFGGLIYTFILTQKQTEKLEETNRIMRETHNAERRPWLSIEIELDPIEDRQEFPLLIGDPGDTPIWLKAIIKNHGESPAENVNVRIMLTVDGTINYSSSLSEKIDSVEISDSWNTTVFPSQTVPRLAYALVKQTVVEDEIAKNPKGVEIGIFACVEYTSKWTEGIRRTCCAYSVEWGYPDVLITLRRLRNANDREDKRVGVNLERSTAS